MAYNTNIISNQDGYHHIYDKEYRINNNASDIFNLHSYQIYLKTHIEHNEHNESFYTEKSSIISN